jgi:hypothetical protein
LPAKPDLKKIIDYIRAFVRQQKVAEFRIGVTTSSMKLRLGDQSHSLDGFIHHEPLHEDIDRAMTLEWESQLQQEFDTHLKYNKRRVRRVRSLGRTPPYRLYLAWRHIDWRPKHNARTWPANSDLILEALRQSDKKSGTLTVHPNDASYRAALDGPPVFVIAIGEETVHLRWTICRYAWSPGVERDSQTTRGRKKLTGPRLGELILEAEKWVEQNRPRFKKKDRWHVCSCGCITRRFQPTTAGASGHRGWIAARPR